MLGTQWRPLRLTLRISSPFALLRGVAAREISATSSRFRTYEGVPPLASPRRAPVKEMRVGGDSGPLFVLATAGRNSDPYPY